jgi:hypothetical protein
MAYNWKRFINVVQTRKEAELAIRNSSSTIQAQSKCQVVHFWGLQCPCVKINKTRKYETLSCQWRLLIPFYKPNWGAIPSTFEDLNLLRNSSLVGGCRSQFSWNKWEIYWIYKIDSYAYSRGSQSSLTGWWVSLTMSFNTNFERCFVQGVAHTTEKVDLGTGNNHMLDKWLWPRTNVFEVLNKHMANDN